MAAAKNLWIYWGGGFGAIYCQGNNANNYTMRNQVDASGTVGTTRSGGNSRFTTGTLTANTWNHIVYNFNNGTSGFDVWINGVKETLGSFSFGSNGSGNHERIGAWVDTNYGGTYLSGVFQTTTYFDDFRFFNKNLSDSEVALLYAQGKDE